MHISRHSCLPYVCICVCISRDIAVYHYNAYVYAFLATFLTHQTHRLLCLYSYVAWKSSEMMSPSWSTPRLLLLQSMTASHAWIKRWVSNEGNCFSVVVTALMLSSCAKLLSSALVAHASACVWVCNVCIAKGDANKFASICWVSQEGKSKPSVHNS